MNDPSPRWTQLAAAMREAGVNAPPAADDLTPPPGFATRVVARSREEAAPDLSAWKRLSLLGAGTAAAALAVALVMLPTPDRGTQFLPVPALDFPADPTK